MASKRVVPLLIFGLVWGSLEARSVNLSMSQSDSLLHTEYRDAKGNIRGECHYDNSKDQRYEVNYTLYPDGSEDIEVNPKTIDPEEALRQCKELARQQAKETEETIRKTTEQIRRQHKEMRENMDRKSKQMKENLKKIFSSDNFKVTFPPGFPFSK